MAVLEPIIIRFTIDLGLLPSIQVGCAVPTGYMQK